MIYRFTCIILLATLLCHDALADPFLEPQVLPAELRNLNFQDSETGLTIPVRLDENHLPVTADFFAEGATMPFQIKGLIVDSPSGSQLHAWQLAPKAEGNGIAILYLHGNGGNILSNLGGGIALVKKGFTVTILDYSGFGYSSGEATRDNILIDANAALEVVAAMARSAGQQLVLLGQSLGGHLAVVVAAENPGRVDGLVIEGAFSSHKAMAAHHKGVLAKAFVSEPYSAQDSIGDVTQPLLVVHSRDDEVVPLSMGQTLFEAANEPKTFMKIEGPHLAGLGQYGDEIAAAVMMMMANPEDDLQAPGPE